MVLRALIVPALALFASPSPAKAEAPVSAADRLAHEEMLVLDTHLDTPMVIERPGWDFTDYHFTALDHSQVDLPRMQEGGLDGGFFAIYTPQGPLTPDGYAAARAAALARAATIQRLVAAHPDKLAFATSADDAARIAASGKRVVYQSIENSYPVGTDLSMLASFYKLGVRMAGPVHFKNNQFADSSTDKPKWKGLSPLGRAWVAEMNRLGMVIDASHASDAAFDQMLALSKTPIILSHSGPRAIFDHPRNIDDDRMRRLAKAGGVIQVYTVHLAAGSSDERDKIEERQRQFATLGAEERRKLVADEDALDAREAAVRPTFEKFMASLLHAIEVMGVDHVGFGADWDGGGGVIGMEDVSALPRVTAALRQAGYSDADIAKIWSGNVLRVLRQAEDAAEKSK